MHSELDELLVRLIGPSVRLFVLPSEKSDAGRGSATRFTLFAQKSAEIVQFVLEELVLLANVLIFVERLLQLLDTLQQEYLVARQSNDLPVQAIDLFRRSTILLVTMDLQGSQIEIGVL